MSFDQMESNSLRTQVADAFAEVVCLSSDCANEVLQRFPEYRISKEDDCWWWQSEAPREMLLVLSEMEVTLSETVH